MTRSHTAKNNNGMGDRRYATNGLNNNRVVGSSPSKLELSVNNNEPCNTNEDVKAENRVTQKNTKTIKSNSSTPTKKSVANSILSFTSSFLAAAAASSTATEILPMSPTQSPKKERHQVIDLSSNHSTPLKRASTPSASPTRRGGRATKPSPHQGTPPQSPPTPHKIICQSTVETIEPTIQSTASDDDSNEKGQQNYSSSRIRGSPNKKKCSPGSKLISALSPKKKSSSADKKHPLDQTIPTSSEYVETETGESKTISNADEASNMSARRNLTSSFFLNNAREPTAEVNGTVVTRPKKRNGYNGTRSTPDDTCTENNHSALRLSNRDSTLNTSEGKIIPISTKNTKVTDFFPIRRSERKPKNNMASKQLSEIIERLTTNDSKCQSGNSKENKDLDANLGIGIKWYEGKGRGIEARKRFVKGDFVVEYAGDLIEGGAAAKTREGKYAKDSSKGCYMYYFKHGDKSYCIDATSESGRLGRLVNHSRVHPNLQTKVVIVKDTPRLLLVAKKDIEPGTEVLYDYGDRSKESLLCHPWLAL